MRHQLESEVSVSGKTVDVLVRFFFFQAEDGIRDIGVTGVQTCALPICIGYVFGGERGLYERLPALDNLRYFAELYGVPPREQKRRIEELLELVGLKGREKERVEGYSRGMRQRLHIARGLLHDPKGVFLDAPAVGDRKDVGLGKE